MLVRCYNINYHKTRPTYIGCEVTKEWHNFQVFGDWFEENHVESFDLDKDLLFRGNKIYSPETCCFVPQEINKTLIKCSSKRNEFPIGVSYNKKRSKFQVAGKVNGTKYFDCIEKAFNYYVENKKQHIKILAEKYKDRLIKQAYHTLLNYEIEITD